MLEFNYKAITPDGRTVSGRQSATSEEDLEGRLSRMQLELLDAKLVSNKSVFGRKKLESKELINIFIHVQTLSQAGVPLFESLIDLRDSADEPAVKRFVSDLVDRIEGGASLSDALEQSPAGIDKVNVSLIRTGEATGKLPEVLAELVESLKWSNEIAAQTKKMLMYPMFAGTFVLGAVGFLMIYLVPQLIPFLKNLGLALPIQTRALVAFSNFLKDFWYYIPITVALIFAAWTTAVRISPGAALWIDGAKLKLPQIGPVLKKIIMARFARSFGLMYKSGVSVLDGLGYCESLSSNLAFRQAINGAALNISQGQKVSDAFAATTLFPPLVVRMIRVGETTGGLDKALDNVSYFYTREVNDSIEKMQGLITPILTVFLGAMIIWIMSAVLLPVYDMFSKLKL